MNLVLATTDDAPAMASAHAQAFDKPWDEADFAGLLETPGVFCLLAREHDPAGVVAVRSIAGEAEILTLAVAPWAQRRGVGLALMNAAIVLSRQGGAEAMFLEVDVANDPAVGLYEGLGFVRSGLRKGYYDRGAEGRADALVMRLDLKPGDL